MNTEQMGDAIDLLSDHPDIKEIIMKKHPEKGTEIETEIKEREEVLRFLENL